MIAGPIAIRGCCLASLRTECLAARPRPASPPPPAAPAERRDRAEPEMEAEP